jgi:8-hydroxy-5-deazaflavin:NADPH oxidoreductase
MKYAIGSGKNIEVEIANIRGPETPSSLVHELGPGVRPQSIEDAYEADTLFLAVPFRAQKHITKQPCNRDGKIVIDLTNAIHVAPQELGGLFFSEVVSQPFVGARRVKAFNHPPAPQLGTNPSLEGAATGRVRIRAQ